MIVTTGPLTAVYRGAALHDIRVSGVRVAERVHLAVRDPDWGTIPLDVSAEQVDARPGGFVIACRLATGGAAMPFTAQLRIEGDGGVVRFVLCGRAEATFRTNRIGFCVLHPRELAGVAARVLGPDGWTEAAFPTAISPHQPFTDLMALRHAAGPGHVAWCFDGELFETEDQRNWTDPSFKTFCPPLRLPFPRTVGPDTPIRQEITLTATGPVRSVETASALMLGPASDPPVVEVRVGGPDGGSVPGTGFSLPATGARLEPVEVAALAALAPAHLRVVLDAAGDWPAVLAAAAQDAATVGSPLEVEVVSRDTGADVEPLIAAVVQSAAPVCRVHLYDADTSTTGSALAAAGRRAAAAAGLSAPVGGGSRANFAELNRAQLPLELLDFLAYPISPQVHAFDDASVLGTVTAQGDTLRDARRRAAGRPVVVGPVTLLPRFNPVATTGRVPVLQDHPPPADPRQQLPIAAAWTVGSLAALRDADAVTLFDAAGPGGPLEHDTRFPVYEVLAALAPYTGGRTLRVDVVGEGIHALGVHRDGRALVLLANLTLEPHAVRLHGRRHDRWRVVAGGAPGGRRLLLPALGVAALEGVSP